MPANLVEAEPRAKFYVFSELGRQIFATAEGAAQEAARQLRTGTPRIGLGANGIGLVRQGRVERLKEEIASLLP